ncbi:MAG: hypothetical protein WCK80_00420 [bacterium]
MKSTNHKGFSHFETILLLVVVAVISVVGFTVYSRNNKSKADTDPAVVLRQQNQSRQPEMYNPDKTTPQEQESLAAAGLLTEANANAVSNKTMARKSSSTKVKWIPYAPALVASGRSYAVYMCEDFMNIDTQAKPYKTNLLVYAKFSKPYNGVSVELSHDKGYKAKKISYQLNTEPYSTTHAFMGYGEYVTLTVRKPGHALVLANRDYAHIAGCHYYFIKE